MSEIEAETPAMRVFCLPDLDRYTTATYVRLFNINYKIAALFRIAEVREIG